MKILAALFTLFLLLGNVNAQQEKPVTPAADSTIGKSITKADTATNSGPFVKVEKEAYFPGGMKGWITFLEENLNTGVADKDHLKPGHYPVLVQFVVDEKGSITDVQVKEKVPQCPHCVQEAKRIFKKCPKWIPAVLNGQNVKYMANQQITFTVSNE